MDPLLALLESHIPGEITDGTKSLTERRRDLGTQKGAKKGVQMRSKSGSTFGPFLMGAVCSLNKSDTKTGTGPLLGPPKMGCFGVWVRIHNRMG